MPTRPTSQTQSERAAALLAEQERRERRRQYAVVGAVVAVLVLVGGLTWFALSRADTTGEADVPPAGATDSYGLAVGSADADHDVVVYEDFLCPACRAFEEAVSDELDRLVDDGTVQVEYRPFNWLSQYGDYSARATNAFAVVLDTAGPEVAKRFHDALYAEQPPESGPFPDDDRLVDLAVESGADEQEVRGPIEDMAFEQWVVNASDQGAKGVDRGTPTVLLDGEVVDGASLLDQLSG